MTGSIPAAPCTKLANALSIALATGPANARSIVTFDIATAATWQSGALVLGFDTIVGAASFIPGTIVPRESQLSDDFDAQRLLSEFVEADQGAFLGIETPGIARARFQHVQSQSAVGFSLDDVAIGRDSPVGDLNGDGGVHGADLGVLLAGWGECARACCAGDLNLVSEINGADLRSAARCMDGVTRERA